MTPTATTAWLSELVRLLGRIGELDESDEQALDAALEAGLAAPLDQAVIAGLDRDSVAAALSMLGAARSVAAAELAAVHRQRIDVDRTVRAITAYVRALS